MSKSVNRVTLLGRLGQDIDLKTTPSGDSVANFSIATDRPIKKDGQWTTETDWHRVVVWGKLASICAEYLGKGSQAYIEGNLRTRKWTDRDGNDRYTTEVNCKDVVFCGERRGQQQDRQPEPPAPAEETRPGSGVYDNQEDVPF